MDIIIFAMIAGIFFYKLYNVLGKNENIFNISPNNSVKDVTPPPENVTINKLEEAKSKYPLETKQIQAYDANFSEAYFLDGAIKAYELILDSFNKNDTKILEYLLDENTYSLFADQLKRNSENSMHVEKVILSLFSTEILDINIISNIALIKVRFTSQQMILEKNTQGEVLNSKTINVEDDWSFSKDLTSKDLNWKLVSV